MVQNNSIQLIQLILTNEAEESPPPGETTELRVLELFGSLQYSNANYRIRLIRTNKRATTDNIPVGMHERPLD